MATMDELSRALVAADKAGDVQAAKILAGEITKLRAPKADDNQFAFDPMRDMSAFERGAAGAGKAITDMARGVGQLIPGLVTREDVAESRKRDAPLMNTTAGAVGNMVGNVVPMMAGGALAPAAATIRGGAAVGSLLGMLQPSTGTGETVGNTLLGGVTGGAVPALATAVRAGRAAAEPFYQAGREAIVGRALNRAAGPDAPAVAQRLREAAQPFVGPSQGVPRTTMGELVPGSLPTVGQAAQNPGVAALERAATATNPEVTNAVSGIMQAQNGARVGALEEMAGRTSGARDFHAAMRDGTANQMYGNARANGLQPLTQQQQAVIGDLMQRPAMRDALAQAQRLAQNEGLNITDPAGSVAGLDYVRRALADQVGAATGNERRILEGVMTRLTGVMDQISPDLRAARETFAGMSRPLNQMDVAHELVQRSVNPLTGNLQPQAFARAVQSDATAARATGMPGATMEGTMAPAQLNALDMILQDVRRANAAQNAGRGAGSDTAQKLAYTNMLDQAGVPTFMRNFAPAQIVGNLGSRGADLAYGRANRELSNRLAEVMLDPAQAATLMLSAGPAGQNALMQLLTRSASRLSLTAPGLANGQQQ